MQKVCSKCKIPYSIENFGFQNKELGIRKSICKGCVKKYNEDRYEGDVSRFIENSASWRRNNRAKYLENQKAYNAARPKSKSVAEKT